jgi:ferric-dicitrate binding protein FerR (iron transport regulator)
MMGQSIGHEMNWRLRVLIILALCLAAGLATSSARAQTRVGEAAVVKNEVVRVTASASNQINVGDALLRDETVRTGADSAARLVMADSTNLSIGANASLKLDRTVFDDAHSYPDISIKLTTGAFRFVTGHSDKSAYKIQTQVATIGVRGTTLDILSQRGKTTVVLQDGQSRVCTLSFQCIDLTKPGDTAVITFAGGKYSIQKVNTPPWTFASNCGAAAGLCSTTEYADASPTVTPPVDTVDANGMLCGR